MVIDSPHNTWGGAVIRLRPLRQEDVEAMQASVENPEGEEKAEDAQRRSPAPPGQEQVNLGGWRSNTTHPNKATWAIETVQGQLVGAIGTADCHRRRGTFKCALALMRPFRRQGYGREAVRFVVGIYFGQGYQKVTVAVPAYNEPAIHFFEALGVTCEGRLRRMVLYQGKHYGRLYFGLTVEEFARLDQHVAAHPVQHTGGRA